MTKKELIGKVSEDTGMSKVDSAVAVDSVLNNIKAEITKGNKVAIADFGIFSVVERAARDGRNPATGAPMRIEASKNVKFKASKGFKESL